MDPAEIRVSLTDGRTTRLALNEESVLEGVERQGLSKMVFVRVVGDQSAPGVLVRAVALPERQVSWVGYARY